MDPPPIDAAADGGWSQLVPRALVRSVPLGALGALGLGLAFGRRAALSSALGTLVASANLWLMRWLVSTLFDESSSNLRRVPAGLLFSTKTIVLLGLIALILRRPWVSGPAFLAGLSIILVSIVAAAWSPGDPPVAP